MFRICHIHIAYDVHDAAVRLLRKALVLAAVARLHVEDGNMQTFGSDDSKAGVGVAQDKHGVRLQLNHQLITLGDDVAHRLAQILSDRIHINLRLGEL